MEKELGNNGCMSQGTPNAMELTKLTEQNLKKHQTLLQNPKKLTLKSIEENGLPPNDSTWVLDGLLIRDIRYSTIEIAPVEVCLSDPLSYINEPLECRISCFLWGSKVKKEVKQILKVGDLVHVKEALHTA